MKKLTDNEISEIINNMVILVDTREQKNQHIINYLEQSVIPYEIMKLDTADYTFKLPNYKHLGLDNHFLVERKGSLDELAGNFTRDRERLTREFERIGDRKIHMVLETFTWKKLLNGSYQSQLNPKSYMASIMTFCIRYNVPMWFAEKSESPIIIYGLLKYELMEYLKKL